MKKDYFAKLWNLVGLVPGLVMMMVVGSSRVFQVIPIDDFFSGAPNMANDMPYRLSRQAFRNGVLRFFT
jgi:hypothetical protein